MKKLLVTGGAGFIGGEFVRQGVRRGYEIVVVDKLTYAGDLKRIKEVEKEIMTIGKRIRSNTISAIDFMNNTD